jgi:hypothetical protein
MFKIFVHRKLMCSIAHPVGFPFTLTELGDSAKFITALK